jgi:CubicO group peptidase (beta-lactamase class C family)
VIETAITQVIDRLEQTGSIIEPQDREYIVKKVMQLADHTLTLEGFQQEIASFLECCKHNQDFGLRECSVGIKIGSLELKINEQIDSLFDIASITKLFTLKLCYELEKQGILHYDAYVTNICPAFTGLKNYTVLDILQMRGKIWGAKKLSESQDKDELYQVLTTIEVVSLDAQDSNYTDLGFTILPFLIEALSPHHQSFAQLMNTYVIKPLGLTHTTYLPKHKRLLGNGNFDQLPHDKKTRILGGVNGAAGLFTDLTDLFRVADHVFTGTFFDVPFMKALYQYHFLDGIDRRRSYAGLYTYSGKHYHNFCPMEFSNKTIAHQGFTGSLFVVDPVNRINLTLLIDAIPPGSMQKSEHYLHYFHKMKRRLVLDSLVVYCYCELKKELLKR